MILLYLLIAPVFYLVLKISIYFIVDKYGKFSYDGFRAAGFAYDSEKDVFYSTKNAWQRSFGYSHIYDVAAPIGRMVIDTEPIRFFYKDKNWLITFWKGQYGITTGAEIGIYNTNDKKVNKKTLYMPIDDKEMLDMSFTLYKKGNVITEINACHWWLAVFKLGMFSKPRDLVMDIRIKFPNCEMLEAFLKAFKKLKYREKDYRIEENTFIFRYKKPRSKQVWTRMWVLDAIRQHYNKINVDLYNKYLSDAIEVNGIDDTRTKDKRIFIKDFIPEVLKTEEEKIDNEESRVNNVVLSNEGVNDHEEQVR